MGNCLFREEEVIRVMKTDGKILEYQAPIKVQQVLSESDFSGHVLSDSFSGSRLHLHPDTKLIPGMLYYLVPLPSPSEKSKKKVRFSTVPEPETQDEQGSDGVVRIKLIISKRELLELVQKGVSVLDRVSSIQSNQSTDDDDNNCRKWKPALESIAEVN